MEIIGEAATRVSPDFCDAHPQIPWPQIVSARNRLIHGYDQINFDILWDILHFDLPSLIASLEPLVPNP